MDKSLFIERRKNVIDSLEPGSLAILRGSVSQHIYSGNFRPFRQNSNFYYLTGLNEPNLIMLLLKTSNSFSEYLFIERVDSQIEKWDRKMLRKEDIPEKCGIEKTHYIDEVYKITERLAKSVCNIYIDEGHNEYIYNKDLSRDIVSHISRLFPSKVFFDIQHIISPFRLIKDEYEIECIRKAIDITKKAIDEVSSILTNGISENEILGHIVKTFLFNNSYATFSPIVASGPSATILHYDRNNRKSLENEVVLIDIGADYEFYSSDITRTLPISGKFTDLQRDAYLMLLDVQSYAFSIAKPGITLTELNKQVREYQRDIYQKNGFSASKEEAEGHIVHNISHYLGLDPHDYGDFGLFLKPGMVITIEPGIYIDEKGLGIRIEDDILITNDGNKNLSKGIIKQIHEVERD